MQIKCEKCDYNEILCRINVISGTRVKINFKCPVCEYRGTTYITLKEPRFVEAVK